MCLGWLGSKKATPLSRCTRLPQVCKRRPVMMPGWAATSCVGSCQWQQWPFCGLHWTGVVDSNCYSDALFLSKGNRDRIPSHLIMEGPFYSWHLPALRNGTMILLVSAPHLCLSSLSLCQSNYLSAQFVCGSSYTIIIQRTQYQSKLIENVIV